MQEQAAQKREGEGRLNLLGDESDSQAGNSDGRRDKDRQKKTRGR